MKDKKIRQPTPEFKFPPSGYLCVCGSTFDHPMERTAHTTECQVWKDHNLGLAVLKEFPQDKYGGYVFASPALLIKRARQLIKEEEENANHNPQTTAASKP